MAIRWPWPRREEPADPYVEEPAYEPPPPRCVRMYRVANTAPRPLVLFLDPSEDAYRLEAGEIAELMVEGPSDHALDWEFGNGTLIITSQTTDATLTLWRNGLEFPPL